MFHIIIIIIIIIGVVVVVFVVDKFNSNNFLSWVKISFKTILFQIHLIRFSPLRIIYLTLRLLMLYIYTYIYTYIYIYGTPILDVSRSHTTTHHSR